MRKITGIFLSGSVFLLSCASKNAVSPVTGVINGKPAVSLYGSSNLPTDYLLIDTATADHIISYEGHVVTYVYFSGTTTSIFIGTGITNATASLYISASGIVLDIDTSHNIVFGSKEYKTR